jgi:hypothetical protein
MESHINAVLCRPDTTTFVSQNIRSIYNNGYPECTKIFIGDLATSWRRETLLPKEDGRYSRQALNGLLNFFVGRFENRGNELLLKTGRSRQEMDEKRRSNEGTIEQIRRF